MKKKLVTGVLMMLCLMAHAQTDKVFVFTFAPQDTVFSLNYGNNRSELSRLKTEIAARYQQIYDDALAVFVSGYCADDFRLAVSRSNQIKSVLILEANMREEFFVTANHRLSPDGKTDFTRVEVRIPQPNERLAENIARRRKYNEPVYGGQPLVAEKTVKKEEPVRERPAEPQKPVREKPTVKQEPPAKQEPPVRQESPAAEKPTVVPAKESDGVFSIRTNLLYWLATLPNLGIEYKPSDGFGILINGGWNHFVWKDKQMQDRSYFIQPELRLYLGEKHRWFLGVEGHAGQFNLKLCEDKDGYQGDLIGGGLTAGYRARLSRVFDMDFSLGLGYTQLKYDEYIYTNNVFVLTEGGVKKNFFGPTQVGVSLIWKIK